MSSLYLIPMTSVKIKNNIATVRRVKNILKEKNPTAGIRLNVLKSHTFSTPI